MLGSRVWRESQLVQLLESVLGLFFTVDEKTSIGGEQSLLSVQLVDLEHYFISKLARVTHLNTVELNLVSLLDEFGVFGICNNRVHKKLVGSLWLLVVAIALRLFAPSSQLLLDSFL